MGHLATYWSGGALRLLPPSALAKAIFAGYLKHVASGAPAQESRHRHKNSGILQDLSSIDRLNQYCVTSFGRGLECNGCSFICKSPTLQL